MQLRAPGHTLDSCEAGDLGAPQPMNRETFLLYIEAYNHRDWATVAGFYTADAVFENFGHHHAGADTQRYLQQLHQGLEDRLKPLVVVTDNANVAMEADCELHALVDLPTLPIGAMKAGERRTVRMFSFYDLEGGKFRHVRVAAWP